MIDYNLHKNTIWLLLFTIMCVFILYKYTKKEGFGFYQNYFPPNPCDVKKQKCIPSKATKELKSSNILFQFPKGTPREVMVRYVGNMFKEKASVAYTNILEVRIERVGAGESEYLDLHSEQSLHMDLTDKNYEKVYIILDIIKTRPSRISIPSINHTLKIPLEFTEKGVVAKIDKTTIAAPIYYFMHYFFDPFYCKGRYEKKLNVVGKDDSNYDYVVKPDNLLDCQWENNNSKIKTCIKHPEIVQWDRPLSIEPDSDSHVRNYVTPSEEIDKCKVKEEYIKTWDARGVPIEKEHKNIKFDQYINHPALYQNNMNGLYDDVFGMSRIIPSFPTGRASGGR